MHDNLVMSSKKINLKSSDGDVFEVEYAVGLMSQTIKRVIDTGCAGDSIPLPKVTSKILVKVIEYCKRHVEVSSKYMETANTVLERWDVDFIKVDKYTLFDFILAANYLKISSLLNLACSKVADMTKGMRPAEIRKFYS